MRIFVEMAMVGSARLKKIFFIAALCSVIFGYGQNSHALDLPCPAPFGKLLSDSEFDHYKLPETMGYKSSPAPPNVESGRALLYRTVIRDGAKVGPNFAGHFTIIPIGCGAATICLAIVDSITGKIYFPAKLNSVEALLVDTGGSNISTLNYRRNSRLLVVVGSPNEKRAQAGMSYYVWKAGRLRLVRFAPAAKLCGLPSATQF